MGTPDQEIVVFLQEAQNESIKSFTINHNLLMPGFLFPVKMGI